METEISVDLFNFGEGIQKLMTVDQPPENAGSSFTALLELPPTQAVELLHSPELNETPKEISGDYRFEQFYKKSYLQTYNSSSMSPIPARLPIFAAAFEEKSFETMPLISYKVKNEPTDDSIINATAQNDNQKSVKRKDGDKRVKVSNKKRKRSVNERSSDAEQLPYVHVRARRGQATDSHSLAERARREKINAKMKLLQELVPGCNKISGTTLVLDEIINHVQSLQNQVELLSMKLAAVNPRVDFNIESSLLTESGSFMDSSNFPNIFAPMIWPEVQITENRQGDHQSWQFDAFHQPRENSLLSHDSSVNSVSLHSNQMKMEI